MIRGKTDRSLHRIDHRVSIAAHRRILRLKKFLVLKPLGGVLFQLDEILQGEVTQVRAGRAPGAGFRFAQHRRQRVFVDLVPVDRGPQERFASIKVGPVVGFKTVWFWQDFRRHFQKMQRVQRFRGKDLEFFDRRDRPPVGAHVEVAQGPEENEVELHIGSFRHTFTGVSPGGPVDILLEPLERDSCIV